MPANLLTRRPKSVALSRAKKEEVVKEASELLKASKITVVANYQGTSVKELQELRRAARENGTKVKVIKNRLFRQALASADKYKDLDTEVFTNQLLYAFNAEDEVAPAQALARFAKSVPSLQFVGAISDEGKFIGADDVKALASLPGKPQLIAELIATLNSPLDGVLSGTSSGIGEILSGLEAKAT